jgi:hypothetical protein
MARTFRDHERWFWKHHKRSDECMQWGPLYYIEPRSCDTCLGCPPPWSGRGPASDWGGSAFHRDCRRHERARARSLMQRGRSGQVDWDDLTISYRRPHFW